MSIEELTERAHQRPSSGSHAYWHIRKQIADGEVGAGQRVTEQAIAESLEMSRGPVREALERLSAEGLLAPRPKGGRTVPKLERRELIELIRCRGMLESEMSFQAAEHATEVQVQDLETIIEVEPHQPAGVDPRKMEVAFHSAIGEIAGNAWALKLLGQVNAQLERYGPTVGVHQSATQSFNEHLEIVEAIRRGDSMLAGQRATQHASNLEIAAVLDFS